MASLGNSTPHPNFADLKRMKVRDLRSLCKSVGLDGNVAKQDLLPQLCVHYGISRSGNQSLAPLLPAKKPRVTYAADDTLKEEFSKLPPYHAVKSCWTTDIRGVPPVSFEQVKYYLIESNEKTFDKEALRAYKAMKAYKLWDGGHVHSLQLHYLKNISKKFMFVKGCVNASEDTHKTYTVHITIASDGCIYGGSCQCVAGLGEACSHIAAMLFALEDFVANGYKDLENGPATTEVLCKWIAKKDSKVIPKPLSEIDVYKPEHGKEVKRDSSTQRQHDGRAVWQRQVDYDALLKLQGRLLNSAVVVPAAHSLAFHRVRPAEKKAEIERAIKNANSIQVMPEHLVISLHEDFTVALNTTVSTQIPPTVINTNVQEINCTNNTTNHKLLTENKDDDIPDNADLSSSFFVDKFVNFKESMKSMTTAEVKIIQQHTKGQSKNPQWFEYRAGRVTASKFGRIKKMRESTPPDNLVKEIMQYDKKSSVPKACQYGLDMEGPAVDIYLNEMRKRGHTSITGCTTGFIIDVERPWQGASVDLLVEDLTVNDKLGIAEIKNPVSNGLTLQEIAKSRGNSFCLLWDENSKMLKVNPKHDYYFQIMGQMGILKRKWCDFVVCAIFDVDTIVDGGGYDVYIERVSFDEGNYSDLCKRVEDFFVKGVVPEILTHRVKRGQPLYPNSSVYVYRKTA
ncbi:uncharacterized protein [Ptychodera flava]|uniref:uncharacterized protein n=1 Tax=Ptychodera flava TaxID=63121 RepID=UPI00396A350C